MRIVANDLLSMLEGKNPTDLLTYHDGDLIEAFLEILGEIEPDMAFPDAGERIHFIKTRSSARRLASVEPKPGGLPGSMIGPRSISVSDLQNLAEQVRKCYVPGLLSGAHPLDTFFMATDPLEVVVQEDYQALLVAIKAEQHKAAVVFAGAVVEGVLCFALNYADESKLIVPRDERSSNGHKPIEEWTMASLLHASAKMNIISSLTKNAADVLRDSRNLIHPGKVVAKGEVVNRGNATIAKGVVEKVAAEVMAWIGMPPVR